MASIKGFGWSLLCVYLCITLAAGFDFFQFSSCVTQFGGVCQNGEFENCPAGYEPYTGSEGTIKNYHYCYSYGVCCILRDPCAVNTCSVDAICSPTASGDSFTCACRFGFEGSPYNSVCTDINECTDGSSPCGDGADCINFDGGFVCSCPNGYSGDAYTACLDVNECLPVSPCPGSEVCNNIEGSYSCSCPTGYERDATSACIDIDECVQNIDECSEFATCDNTAGSYTCTCSAGYSGDGITCTNINECLGTNACVENAVCNDNEGSYTCQCADGYSGDGFVSCTNVNECTDLVDGCSDFATCSDTPGSYTCTCFAGYTGDGFTCTPINECDFPELNDCVNNAICTDTITSYTCQCAEGYSGVGNNECTNINECLSQPQPCSSFASCTDTVGSYECTCNTGYSGDGFTCTDIDECALSLDSCADNAVCTDTDGSFDCTCAPGFSGNGFSSCTDIDECAQESDSCSALATCANTVGSYTCTCNPGYSGDGVSCSNIDECVALTHNCSLDADCTDAVPFFTCQCKEGYYGDGFTCVASLNHPECGVVYTRRIGAGLQTTACQNPWHVQIRSFMSPSFFQQNMASDPSLGIGSGVLIQDKWILTNTWTLTRSRLSPNHPPFNLAIFANVGDYDLDIDEGTEQYIRVKNVIFHPKSQFRSSDDFLSLAATNRVNPNSLTDLQKEYAFALVELETPVEINNCVRPACMPLEIDYPETCEKHNCRFTGWGENENRDILKILQKGDVDLFDAATCKNLNYYMTNGTNIPTPTTTQCALSPNGSIPCEADYGGPLVCQDLGTSRYVLEALNLVDSTSCDIGTGLPFMVSRVRDVIDWIAENIQAAN